ncbi:Golgi resident protein GCP60-like [Anneissia japonica]|uniref:Golgi resident protein GCP60-like n=1 Tax=Anneissia japonica TaxID=1529436 RepID=UPI00142585B3|nr:Golgi resident protein GCP60-like [Anneissia japonica]
MDISNASDDSLTLKTEDKTNVSHEKTEVDPEVEWGFPLEEIYEICLQFYKDKEGSKAIHLSYEDKLKLIAYTRQVSHGKYDPTSSPSIGYFDVVGNDRRREWQSLGDLSKSDAMLAFCKHLTSKCAKLKPYIEAQRWEKEEKERKRIEAEKERIRKEEEEKERIRQEEVRKKLEEEKLKQEQQRLQIKESIYQQVLPQVQAYAAQQYPTNPQQQQAYIKQLQEHYYQQYMQQMYQQQQGMQQPQQATQNSSENLSESFSNMKLQNGPPNGDVPTQSTSNNVDETPVADASIWTRPQIKEFKEQLSKDSEAVITVGRGETVTVRVPTHDEGACIFWEFATDHYDLGFGLYFEWTEAQSNAISVHVSESSDEEEELEDEDGKADLESGSGKSKGPPTDEIIPIFRRDSHEEVFAGSHAYPGKGIYLLRFDNSYSLFRSKKLYYRVYYSK